MGKKQLKIHKNKMEKQSQTKRVGIINIFCKWGVRGTGNTKDTRIRRNV